MGRVKFITAKQYLTLTALVVASPAFAYVGPGAGLSVIGSLLAFVAAIVVGIFGFLWFPIRRMMRKRKAKAEAAAADSGHNAAAEAATESLKQGEGEP